MSCLCLRIGHLRRGWDCFPFSVWKDVPMKNLFECGFRTKTPSACVVSASQFFFFKIHCGDAINVMF